MIGHSFRDSLEIVRSPLSLYRCQNFAVVNGRSSCLLVDVDETLAHSIRALLIGHGTGKSSAVELLMNYLKTHHFEIAQRVRATETAGLSALTEPEIEVIAKKYMIAVL
jgi:hypothetical protein